MKQYTFIGTEEDLIRLGFTYRKHYGNYLKILFENNHNTKQDLICQINSKTKEVDIFIHTLRGHRNEENEYRVIQADIYPMYLDFINDLITEEVITESSKEKVEE